MTRRIVLVGIAAALVLAGCGWLPTQEPIPVDVTDVIQLLDGDTALSDAGYDFGPVNPDADPVTATLSVQNAGEEAVTVSQATVDNDVFTLGSTSFTVEPGQSADLSATFAPVASGEETGTVTITVEGFEDDPLSFTLTGEGNYPPVAYAVVEVTGGGTAEANGTYRRTAPQFSDFQDPPYMIPLYEKSDTGPYIWGEPSEGSVWGIGDTLEADLEGDPPAAYYTYLYTPSTIPPFGAPGTDSQWSTGGQGDAPTPTVVSEISGYAFPGELFSGDTITAEYEYVDPEGDADASTYQWYRGSSLAGVDMTDPTTLTGFTAIDGATGRSYTAASDDLEGYLIVEVTPVAETGVTEGGASVFLGPTPTVSPE